ncbi:hypothetical protein Pelo_12469 [Pelomyxa schiedti]|nr:hypothetical protein Pelo_12469 [Pelomyxa schiedti]
MADANALVNRRSTLVEEEVARCWVLFVHVVPRLVSVADCLTLGDAAPIMLGAKCARRATFLAASSIPESSSFSEDIRRPVGFSRVRGAKAMGSVPKSASEIETETVEGILSTALSLGTPVCALSILRDWELKYGTRLGSKPGSNCGWVIRSLVLIRVSQLLNLNSQSCAVIRLRELDGHFPCYVVGICTTGIIEQAALTGNPDLVKWCLRNGSGNSNFTIASLNAFLHTCTSSNDLTTAQKVYNSLQEYISAPLIKSSNILGAVLNTPNPNRQIAVWLINTFSLGRKDFVKHDNILLRKACSDGNIEHAMWLYTTLQLTPADARSMGGICLNSAICSGHFPIVKWLVEDVGLNERKDLLFGLAVSERNNREEITQYLKSLL